MKAAGISMIIIGLVFLIFALLAFFDILYIDRGSDYAWTYTWAIGLGFFIFFGGLGLFVASLKRSSKDGSKI